MSDDLQPPEATGRKEEAKPKPGFFKTLKESGYRALFEQYPAMEPWREYFGSRVVGIKKTYVICFWMFIVAGLCSYATRRVVRGNYSEEMASTNDFWSSTNTFLLGELANAKQQADDYKRKTDDKITGLNDEILGLKEDNIKLNSQHESDQLRIDQLESTPEIAMLAYSNANVSLQMDVPHFNLQVNGEQLTNNAKGVYLMILTNREIDIAVQNLASHERSVKELTISFASDLDTSNFVSGIADGWWKPDLGRAGGAVHSTLTEVSQSLVTEDGGFSCTPLIISTNYSTPFAEGRIGITAPGLFGVQDTTVAFLFADRVTVTNQGTANNPIIVLKNK